MTPLASNPPPPQPGDALPSLHSRRAYFEQLASRLLTSGVAPDRIGRLVAELDQHVATTGVDPVAELGPVGDLAAALRLWARPGRFLAQLAATAVTGAAIGMLITSAFAAFESPGDPDRWLRPGAAAYVAVLLTGSDLMMAYVASRSGTRRLRSWGPGFVVYLVLAVGTGALQGYQWPVSISTARLALALSTVATVAAVTVRLRLQMVPVPGNASHLRRLGWGLLGRIPW